MDGQPSCSKLAIQNQVPLGRGGPKAVQDRLIGFDHLVGNSLCDAVADKASSILQPGVAICEPAAWGEQLGFAVAERLAIVYARLARQREPLRTPCKAPALSCQSVERGC